MNGHPDPPPGFMRLYTVQVENQVTVLYNGHTGERIGCVGPLAVAAQMAGENVHITTPEGDVQEWSARVGCFIRMVSRPAVQTGHQPSSQDSFLEILPLLILLGLVALLVTTFYVVPLPGIFFDWLTGRFSGAQRGLFLATRGDVLTWVFSVVCWLVLAVIFVRWRRGRVWARTVKVSASEVSPAYHANRCDGHIHKSDRTEQREFPQAKPPEVDGGDCRDLCTDQACAKMFGLYGWITMTDVRRVYRSKIAEYHPDKVAHLGLKLRELAESESRRLNAAYQHFEVKYGRTPKRIWVRA